MRGINDVPRGSGCVSEGMGAPFSGRLCFCFSMRCAARLSFFFFFRDTLAALQRNSTCYAALLTLCCREKPRRRMCRVHSNHDNCKLTVLFFFLCSLNWWHDLQDHTSETRLTALYLPCAIFCFSFIFWIDREAYVPIHWKTHKHKLSFF